jgi:hypothetical protein
LSANSSMTTSRMRWRLSSGRLKNVSLGMASILTELRAKIM